MTASFLTGAATSFKASSKIGRMRESWKLLSASMAATRTEICGSLTTVNNGVMISERRIAERLRTANKRVSSAANNSVKAAIAFCPRLANASAAIAVNSSLSDVLSISTKT